MSHLGLARRGIENLLRAVRYSSVYQTEPEGQRAQPWFLNACCVGVTGRSPGEILRELKRIELQAGRKPGGVRYGPRELDIDILLYGEETVDEPGLRVPHPRLTARAFVLVPLAEIAGDWVDPVSGLTIGELADRVDDSGVCLAGDVPGHRDALDEGRL